MRLDSQQHVPWGGTHQTSEGARPLRVSLLDGSELVTAGFTAMLAPHTRRVRVTPPWDPGTGPAPGDLLLIDFTLLPPAQVEDLLPRVGDACRVVSYTWSGRVPSGPWWSTVSASVAGHVAKSLPAERLIERLERLHREGAARPGAAESSGGRVPVLTPREQDIVSRIARGLSNAEIAEQLYLSINSVKTYVRTAYRRMGVTTRSQAVAWWFAGDLGPGRADAASPEAGPGVRAVS